MPEIIYKIKDDTVSWGEIQNVIFRSHESNRNNGVDIRNAHLTPEQLKNTLGKDGVCFVALDGNKVVGTCSVSFQQKNTWYAQGEVAYLTLAGVLPEYKGRYIFQHLSAMRKEYIIDRGCKTIYMNIAEKNLIRRTIAIKEGFTPMAIHFNPYNPHNYITYCYWVEGKPFSDLKIHTNYQISLVNTYCRMFRNKCLRIGEIIIKRILFS